MKINRTLIIGIILCFIGAIVLYVIIQNSIGKQPAGVKSIPGFAILAIGAYVISLGKKQQKEERENSE